MDPLHTVAMTARRVTVVIPTRNRRAMLLATLRSVLAQARHGAFTQHLEIETYTWNVLPEGLKMDIGASIAREYEWVLREWDVAAGR